MELGCVGGLLSVRSLHRLVGRLPLVAPPDLLALANPGRHAHATHVDAAEAIRNADMTHRS